MEDMVDLMKMFIFKKQKSLVSPLTYDSISGRGVHFIIYTLVLYIVYFIIRLLPYNSTGSIGGMNYNILAYISSLFITFVSYIVIENIIGYTLQLSTMKHILVFLYGSFFLFSIYFLFSCYQNEMSLYGGYDLPTFFFRERVNHFLLIPIFSLIILGMFLVASLHITVHRNIRLIAAVALSTFNALLTFSPNLFLNRFWGLYHTHAYTNSIINIAGFAPYDDIQCSIYGHYGLVYFPFVKLFGNNTTAVAITISLFTFVMMMSSMSVVSSILENDILYYLSITALFGVGVTYFSPGEAFAVMPHRYLFPMVTLAIVSFFARKDQNKTHLLWGICVSTLSVIFNLETGLCCSLVFMFCYLALNWKKDEKRINVFLIVISLLFLFASVGIAYIAVNIYNLMVGGNWNSILTFIYPIGSREYDMRSILTLPIPTWRSGYFLHILIFSYTAFGVIWKVLGRRTSLSCCVNNSDTITAIDLIILSVCVSGLGSLTYFMNRTAAGNLSISHLQFVIILAYYAQKGLTRVITEKKSKSKCSEKGFITALYLLSFYLLSWFAIESIPGIIPTVSNRMNSVWNTESMNESIQLIQMEIPADTLAFGRGVPELYFEMGWNPQIAITDWSDMNRFSLEKVADKVNTCDSYVKTDDVIFNDNSFRLLKHIETEEISFGYYVRETDNDDSK